MALIRYPGSKDRLYSQIWSYMPDGVRFGSGFFSGINEYREPFFGAGAVGIRLMGHLNSDCSIWLNDRDYYIASLWNAVRQQPRELAELVRGFTPTKEKFFEFKAREMAGALSDPVVAAFEKLAIHQISFSGLGPMAGGPLGGVDGNSEYPIDCRWNVPRILEDIQELNGLLTEFKRLRITCRDFAELVACDNPRAFIYLDPPYYAKGEELYKHSMGDADHERLARALRGTKASWLLSYDDHPRVRELYAWCEIKPIAIKNTIAIATGFNRPKNHEIVIMPRAD